MSYSIQSLIICCFFGYWAWFARDTIVSHQILRTFLMLMLQMIIILNHHWFGSQWSLRHAVLVLFLDHLDRLSFEFFLNRLHVARKRWRWWRRWRRAGAQDHISSCVLNSSSSITFDHRHLMVSPIKAGRGSDGMAATRLAIQTGEWLGLDNDAGCWLLWRRYSSGFQRLGHQVDPGRFD